MDTLIKAQILLSGLISGWIVFQTAFVAPIVFTKLEDAQKALVLRAIFPKLFKAITVAGVIYTGLEAISGLEILQLTIGAYTILSGIVCNALIPATNRARDNGDQKKFALLHKISVLLTMGTLLLHLGWMFFV